MSNWKYISDQEKQEHELYKKRTAFGLFLLYLKVQFVLSFLSIFGSYAEYSQSLRDYNIGAENTPSFASFIMIFMIPCVLLLVFILLFDKYGKSRTTIKLFITFLIAFPLASFIVTILASLILDVDINVLITKNIGLVGFFVFVGVIFAIYSLFSKSFNLQYLNRLKT